MNCFQWSACCILGGNESDHWRFGRQRGKRISFHCTASWRVHNRWAVTEQILQGFTRCQCLQGRWLLKECYWETYRQSYSSAWQLGPKNDAVITICTGTVHCIINTTWWLQTDIHNLSDKTKASSMINEYTAQNMVVMVKWNTSHISVAENFHCYPQQSIHLPKHKRRTIGSVHFWPQWNRPV